jgi:hypothetical protein
MTPARLDLHIIQGATLRKPLLLMQPVYQYHAISAIQQTAPLLLSVPAHGLVGSWPIWIEGVSGWSELNKDKTREQFRLAKVVDANTLELNSINGLGRSGSGGVLVYQAPVDLTGCSAQMMVRDASGALLLDLSTANGRLVFGDGRIVITLTAAETAAITWTKGVYDFELTMSNGEVKRWAQGDAVVSRENTYG